MIFRELYREMPLSEYLPPGTALDGHVRQAHLQRLAIMATKLLAPEAILELRALGALAEKSPWSDRERAIIHSIVNRTPFYQQGSLCDFVEFLEELCRLARSCPGIRILRAEMSRALRARIGRPDGRRPREIFRLLRSVLRLYLPHLPGRLGGVSAAILMDPDRDTRRGPVPGAKSDAQNRMSPGPERMADGSLDG
jgi:hypothetical protein